MDPATGAEDELGVLNLNVCFWHLADISERLGACPLSWVKRTSPDACSNVCLWPIADTQTRDASTQTFLMEINAPNITASLPRASGRAIGAQCTCLRSHKLPLPRSACLWPCIGKNLTTPFQTSRALPSRRPCPTRGSGLRPLGPCRGISSATYTVVSVTTDRGHDASDMDHRGLAGHLVIFFVFSTS
jgi:hypothetical protein